MYVEDLYETKPFGYAFRTLRGNTDHTLVTKPVMNLCHDTAN